MSTVRFRLNAWVAGFDSLQEFDSSGLYPITIETDKGGLWMRWLGESNGCYSETVNLIWLNKPGELEEE